MPFGGIFGGYMVFVIKNTPRAGSMLELAT